MSGVWLFMLLYAVALVWWIAKSDGGEGGGPKGA